MQQNHSSSPQGQHTRTCNLLAAWLAVLAHDQLFAVAQPPLRGAPTRHSQYLACWLHGARTTQLPSALPPSMYPLCQGCRVQPSAEGAKGPPLAACGPAGHHK
jgi:hypothetical protein